MTATEMTDPRCASPHVAVLFDFNGVLVDDEPIHFQAFQTVLGMVGLLLRPDAYRRYLGLDDRSTLAAVVRDAGAIPQGFTREDLDHWVARKQEIYAALLEQGRLEGRPDLFPGAFELVRSLHSAGIPLAIVSGARRAEIDASLVAGHLVDYFSVIIAAEDVASCKPDPTGYRLAFKRLRAISPGVVMGVAIEDAPTGITAARAAGLRTIGVTTSCTPRELAGADRIVHALTEIDSKVSRVTSWEQGT